MRYAPAFPYTFSNVHGEFTEFPGLTKREYFVALALQGTCANASANYSTGPCNAAIAARAVVLADALIAALEQQT